MTVHALTEIGSAGALQALERGVEDSDREVRISTVRAFAGIGFRAHRRPFGVGGDAVYTLPPALDGAQWSSIETALEKAKQFRAGTATPQSVEEALIEGAAKKAQEPASSSSSLPPDIPAGTFEERFPDELKKAALARAMVKYRYPALYKCARFIKRTFVPPAAAHGQLKKI